MSSSYIRFLESYQISEKYKSPKHVSECQERLVKKVLKNSITHKNKDKIKKSQKESILSLCRENWPQIAGYLHPFCEVEKVRGNRIILKFINSTYFLEFQFHKEKMEVELQKLLPGVEFIITGK